MNMYIPKHLGNKLRELRLSLGWTQDEMATALGRVEKSRRSRVYEWETSSRIPSLGILLRYSKIFNVPTDDLLDDKKKLDLSED